MSHIHINATLSTIEFVGSFQTNQLDLPSILINQTSLCHIMVATTSLIKCQILKYSSGHANITFSLFEFSKSFDFYLPPKPKEEDSNSNLSSFIFKCNGIGLNGYGHFGNDQSIVNISLISNNGESNAGKYIVDFKIGNHTDHQYLVYFGPKILNSSSSSTSSNNDEINCTLNSSGQLHVQCLGNTSINCTTHGISECYSPNGYHCNGVTESSITQCIAPQDILCKSDNIICRAGHLTCSVENGKLIQQPCDTYTCSQTGSGAITIHYDSIRLLIIFYIILLINVQ
ncbi:hypothetical protein DFA_11802 [Cavenderia fasciculata]|uniref:Uncharacterized protein n=1 Tax=Cavenderia fasciculata TaxID=261658 RepID=F4QE92_CACFS|nr:uncharacterized protein DFA_11802 [Cavenderia fasciculata]EGG14039.1 hypothetical protein DFA_11802 [Cavenderia fasciculata]|eukprot:XP_004350747.1 hypothetical protein DFA_11802 [Cavenderia fasciculata]